MLSAMEALAPALVLELTPMRVNAVTPDLIDTPPSYRLRRRTGHHHQEPGSHSAGDTRRHDERGRTGDPNADDQ